MATTIPAPEPGASFINEATGVIYNWDGEKWVAEPGEGHSHPEGELDERYVNTEGDIMTGQLQVYSKVRNGTGLLVRPGAGTQDEDTGGLAAFVNTKGQAILEIKNNNGVRLGDINNNYIPTNTKDAVNLGYLEYPGTHHGPAKFSWIMGSGERPAQSKTPIKEFWFDPANSNWLYISAMSNNKGSLYHGMMSDTGDYTLAHDISIWKWYPSVNRWRLMITGHSDKFRINQNSYEDFRFHFDRWVPNQNQGGGQPTFTPGEEYHITVGGLF